MAKLSVRPFKGMYAVYDGDELITRTTNPDSAREFAGLPANAKIAGEVDVAESTTAVEIEAEEKTSAPATPKRQTKKTGAKNAPKKATARKRGKRTASF